MFVWFGDHLISKTICQYLRSPLQISIKNIRFLPRTSDIRLQVKNIRTGITGQTGLAIAMYTNFEFVCLTVIFNILYIIVTSGVYSGAIGAG